MLLKPRQRANRGGEARQRHLQVSVAVPTLSVICYRLSLLTNAQKFFIDVATRSTVRLLAHRAAPTAALSPRSPCGVHRCGSCGSGHISPPANLSRTLERSPRVFASPSHQTGLGTPRRFTRAMPLLSSRRSQRRTMSWQAYVDDNLLKSGMVTSAGIYDLQGNPWAYSAGFAAQVAEVAAVSGHMHTGDPSGLAGTGVCAPPATHPALARERCLMQAAPNSAGRLITCASPCTGCCSGRQVHVRFGLRRRGLRQEGQ